MIQAKRLLRVGGLSGAQVDEPHDALHLRIIQLRRLIPGCVVIGVEAGGKQHGRNALDQKRPGIAPANQLQGLIVELAQDSPIESIEERLRRVFGIANFVVAWEVAAEIEAIRSVLADLIGTSSFESFKIDARRGTKDFPLNSQQLNQQLGSFVQERTKAKVRMENPDAVFYVEIVRGRAFLYLRKIPGSGGLPSGTGGKVLCLLSGGIDSPVAA